MKQELDPPVVRRQHGWTAGAASALAYGSMPVAVRTLGSTPLSLLGALEPVIGIVLAATVLHERLAPLQWLDVVVILASCASVPFVVGRRSEPSAAARHPLSGIGAGESPNPDEATGRFV